MHHFHRKASNLAVPVIVYVTAIGALVVTWVVTSRVLVAILVAAVAVIGGALLMWVVARGRRVLDLTSTPTSLVPPRLQQPGGDTTPVQ